MTDLYFGCRQVPGSLGADICAQRDRWPLPSQLKGIYFLSLFAYKNTYIGTVALSAFSIDRCRSGTDIQV